MCGIIGIVSRSVGVKIKLINALKKLEYRGYDSAGIAIRDGQGKILIIKKKGKISLNWKKLSEK